MLSFYVNAVKYNYMTIDQVPAHYQEMVKAELGIVDEVVEA